MEFSTLEVEGARLAVVTWKPEGSVKGVVQILHGMAEHIRRYDYAAQQLNKAGFAVVGHDHRGHGHSAKEPDLGKMGPWQPVVDDVRRVNEWIQSAFPSVPVIVLAHSMGSFMAQQLMEDAPGLADAWILSGSNGKPPALAAAGRLIARIERFRLAPDKPSALLEKLSFGKFNEGFDGRTGSEWLSRDASQVDDYVNDPMCGFTLSTESWVGLLDALGPIADPYNQRKIPPGLPVYIIGGGADPVSENGDGLRRLHKAYEAAGLRDVTLKLYPEARHELLNETNRDEVIADLIGWVNSRIS